jgi:hypothetical protein
VEISWDGGEGRGRGGEGERGRERERERGREGEREMRGKKSGICHRLHVSLKTSRSLPRLSLYPLYPLFPIP